jgi:hypothetical protein
MSGNVRIGRRLYLVEDKSRVVEDGDPEAMFLLCPKGGEVSHATAARYGLLESSEAAPEPEDQEQAEPEKKTPAAANKAGRRPADKSRTPEGDK